jgi:predicted  nucleic acid-binding Zn-ribbon protein
MSQHLLDSLARYQEFEEYAQKLVNLVNDDDELDLTPNDAELIMDSLEDLKFEINKRIHDVSGQIEADRNESMDRFRRRDVS